MLKFVMMVVFMLAAAPALAAVDCEDWLRGEEFFETATVDDVRSCIEAGADVNARGGEYEATPLHLAVGSRENFDFAVIAVLIETGADVSARDRDGDTPLHWAVRNDHASSPLAIAGLIMAGADVNARNYEDYTPAGIAYVLGNSCAVAVLYLAGAME